MNGTASQINTVVKGVRNHNGTANGTTQNNSGPSHPMCTVAVRMLNTPPCIILLQIHEAHNKPTAHNTTDRTIDMIQREDNGLVSGGTK